MRCQDCGAPCRGATIVCPFCGFEVGLQRVSERQRVVMSLAIPVFRLAVLLFLLFFLRAGGELSNFGSPCCGNIGG